MRLSAFAAVVLVLSLTSFGFACGGGGANGSAKAPPPPTHDAGAQASAPALTTSPPPSGLPPMAAMPPPGVAGSKKGKLRRDPALAACSAAAKASARDPADAVKRLGESCSGPAKMKPASSVMRGQQSDKDPSQEQKLHVEANHCYRLYFVADEAVKELVVVLRDSAGDVIAEAPGPAVPQEGAMCFTTSDDIAVLVGVGSGKGAWAAQVWRD
jgi:hypothetical protein